MTRAITLLAAMLLLLGAAPGACWTCLEQPTAGVAAPPCHESAPRMGEDCCSQFAVTSPAVGFANPAAIDAFFAPMPMTRPASPPSGTVLTLRPPPAGAVPLFTRFSSLRI